jgi:hypothetical protein
VRWWTFLSLAWLIWYFTPWKRWRLAGLGLLLLLFALGIG